MRSHTHATSVKLPASGHGGVRSEGEASRRDRVGDAFFFWSACEAVRHHFRTVRRLTIDGQWCQGLSVGGDLGKSILIIYMHVICLHYV